MLFAFNRLPYPTLLQAKDLVKALLTFDSFENFAMMMTKRHSEMAAEDQRTEELAEDAPTSVQSCSMCGRMGLLCTCNTSTTVPTIDAQVKTSLQDLLVEHKRLLAEISDTRAQCIAYTHQANR